MGACDRSHKRREQILWMTRSTSSYSNTVVLKVGGRRGRVKPGGREGRGTRGGVCCYLFAPRKWTTRTFKMNITNKLRYLFQCCFHTVENSLYCRGGGGWWRVWGPQAGTVFELQVHSRAPKSVDTRRVIATLLSESWMSHPKKSIFRPKRLSSLFVQGDDGLPVPGCWNKVSLIVWPMRFSEITSLTVPARPKLRPPRSCNPHPLASNTFGLGLAFALRLAWVRANHGAREAGQRARRWSFPLWPLRCCSPSLR